MRVVVLAALVLAASAAPASAGTVRVASLHLAFDLPAGWIGHLTPGRFDGATRDGTQVLVIEGVKTSTPLAAIGKNFIAAERKQFPKSTILSQTTKVAGQNAIEVTIRYRGVWAGATGLHNAEHKVWTFRRGAYAYVFDFGARDAAIAKAEPVFVKSIASARFTDKAPPA